MEDVKLIEWIGKLIQEDRLYRFYKSHLFAELRADVLEEMPACYMCGKKATIAHHVNHVRNVPELALSKYWWNPKTRKRERNIVAVCKTCHNILHPEKFGGSKEPVTEERW